MRHYKLLIAFFLLLILGCSEELPTFKNLKNCQFPSEIVVTAIGTENVRLSLKDTLTDIDKFEWKVVKSLEGTNVTPPNKNDKVVDVTLEYNVDYDIYCILTSKCDEVKTIEKKKYRFTKTNCINATAVKHGVISANPYNFNLTIQGTTSDIQQVVWSIRLKGRNVLDTLLYKSDTLTSNFNISPQVFGSGNFTISANITNKCGNSYVLSDYYDHILYIPNDVLSDNMIKVDGGTFKMGSTTDTTALPEHDVTLSDYYLSKYEVTQKLWTTIMLSNPSFFGGCDYCPVEQVSRKDINTFLSRLKLVTGKNYRLPTEAEWEYAAKEGKYKSTFKYSGSNNIYEIAWFNRNSGVNTQAGGKTFVVGTKLKNKLGLYDMTGNVSEVVSDWYEPYSSNPQTNPQGPLTGTQGIDRGGSWRSGIGTEIYADLCLVTFRYYFLSSSSGSGGSSVVGFRLALTP